MRHPYLAAVFFVIILSGCKHKLPEPAQPPQPPAPTPTPSASPTNPADSVCFAEQVLPILASNCAKSGCHGGYGAKQGVVLDSYDNVRATVSGELLMQSIQDTGPLGMPPAPDQKLKAQQIDLIGRWVSQGMRNGIDCQGPCDSSDFTFSKTIQPILADNCMGCHNNVAPVFTSYSGVKTLASSGKLLCVINHASGCAHMPLNAAKLSNCKIRLITKWVMAGAPEN